MKITALPCPKKHLFKFEIGHRSTQELQISEKLVEMFVVSPQSKQMNENQNTEPFP